MRVVHKREIQAISSPVLVKIPHDAKILSTGLQGAIPVIWYEFDSSKRMPSSDRGVYIALTGEEFNFPQLDFVGTLQTIHGYVLHVYAERESKA